MSSLNRVLLIGHLGADPEVRVTPSGATVTNLRLATTEKFKDRDGVQQEKTEWHRVVVWGKTAESCGQYLSKGRQVYVEGSIETREYTDKDGAKRFSTEIKASHVLFLGSKDGGSERTGGPGGARGVGQRQEHRAPASGYRSDNRGPISDEFDDDRLPF